VSGVVTAAPLGMSSLSVKAGEVTLVPTREAAVLVQSTKTDPLPRLKQAKSPLKPTVVPSRLDEASQVELENWGSLQMVSPLVVVLDWQLSVPLVDPGSEKHVLLLATDMKVCVPEQPGPLQTAMAATSASTTAAAAAK